MNPRLTDRDIRLLEMLLNNTVMSFEEIRLYVFGARHKATVCNRLKRLEQIELVRRISVGNFIYKMNMRLIGVVVQITKRGIEVLKGWRKLDERLRSEPLPVNLQSLIHDLELNQVVRGLQAQLAKSVVINGKHLRADGHGYLKKVPDAILELATSDLEKAKVLGLIPVDAKPKTDGSLRFSIELELTAKSDHRYREILNGYRMSRETDRVLYLYHDETVAKKVQSVLVGFPVKQNMRAHQGIFSFLAVDNLARPIAQTKYVDVTDSISKEPIIMQEVANG